MAVLQGVSFPWGPPVIGARSSELSPLLILARMHADDGTYLLQAAFPAAKAWDLRVWDGQGGIAPIFELLDQPNTTGIKAAITPPASTNAWSLDDIGFTYEYQLNPMTAPGFTPVGGHTHHIEIVFHSINFGERILATTVLYEPSRS